MITVTTRENNAPSAVSIICRFNGTKQSDTKKKYSHDIKITKKNLPLIKGEVVGKIKIKDGNNVVGEGDLTVKKSTKKLSYLVLLRNTIYDIASGNSSVK